MIHLAIGRLEIDWGKNSGFTNHSALFQPNDLTDVPYYYADPSEEEYTDDLGERRFKLVAEFKKGLSKPLVDVVDRINLLGHTISVCRKEFEYLSHFNGFEISKFPFEELAQALAEIDVLAISADYGEGEEFGKFFRRQLFRRLQLDKISANPRHVQHNAADAMENLSAYTILQLLAFNPRAHKLPVSWQFADVVDGGWAKQSDVVHSLEPSKRFLIVTEGSSDANILRKAFELLRPHVADFFQFVDMQEGYPFTGTGNLYRFVQGLIGIAIQNNVIVLYDNDAEGSANYMRTRALNIPTNMRVLILPDEESLRMFKTEGPSGTLLADINGRAASIECYLDLKRDPSVRWTSYNVKSQLYQGELLNKEAVTKSFLHQRKRSEAYDYSKIERVLDCIVKACVSITEQTCLADLEHLNGE